MEWAQLYEEIQNKLMNNLQSINFRNNYDYWIFDLDNTIYDFKLGLFRRISPVSYTHLTLPTIVCV